MPAASRPSRSSRSSRSSHPLRVIAVHVEESATRSFVWVLTERESNAWSELDRSASPVPTYRQAVADGLLALQDIVDDLDLGPRRPAGPADTERGEDKEAPSDRTAPKETAPPGKSSFFGFGPVR